jgi:formate dehydrogenase beta subunit
MELTIPGVCLLVDLIRFGSRLQNFPIESDVVIAGGGKLALDAAKICKDLGAETITVIFREKWEDSPVTEEDLSKPGMAGIKLIYNAAVNRLAGKADRLEQVEYIEGDTLKKIVIPAQNLVFASGRFPELIFVKPKTEAAEIEDAAGAESTPDLSLDWEGVQVYKQPAFKDEVGLFAEGDVLADYSAAIKAIGAGRRAAASIHQIMHGISPTLTDNVLTPQSIIQNVYEVEKVEASQRQIMPICSGKELEVCGEIERGFSPEMALEEASRCLQCGLICYERTAPAAEKEEHRN